jgi:multiple sugar transport system substrate-binding protein
LTCDYVSLLYAFGGEFFDKDNKPVFNQGGGLKALQYMVDLINKDKTVDPASLQMTEEDVKHKFEIGKVAMMSNWESMYPELNDPNKSKVVNQTDVGLMPGEGDVVSSAVTGSEGVAIMKTSKHKEAALAFLKWIASKEYQAGEFEMEGQYPTLQDLYQDPDIKKADTTQTLGKISEQFDYGHNRPNAPGYVNWSDLELDLSARLWCVNCGAAQYAHSFSESESCVVGGFQRDHELCGICRCMEDDTIHHADSLGGATIDSCILI